MTTNRSLYIYESLEKLFPDAHCELEHNDNFQLAIAVLLSAQTTDKSVNKVTKALFAKYPDAKQLASADLADVEASIKSLGLYRNKAKNIVLMSKKLVEDFNGTIPDTLEELTELPGIGRKCANVILHECFGKAAIAVDTHVSRVAKRLTIANENDDVLKIELKLQKYFPDEKWGRLHHLLIFFGRYKCKAQNPDCVDCPFASFCRK